MKRLSARGLPVFRQEDASASAAARKSTATAACALRMSTASFWSLLLPSARKRPACSISASDKMPASLSGKHRVGIAFGNIERFEIERARRRHGIGIAAIAFHTRELRNPVALAQGLGEHLVELILGGERDGQTDSATEAAVRFGIGCDQRIIDSVAEQARGGGIVEDREARRHVGLEREALQEAFAERVDGLHLEAARRLDRPSEQLAGGPALTVGRRPAEQIDELFVERLRAPSSTSLASSRKTRCAISAAAALV